MADQNPRYVNSRYVNHSIAEKNVIKNSHNTDILYHDTLIRAGIQAFHFFLWQVLVSLKSTSKSSKIL